MAFGVDRQELRTWKQEVKAGKVAFLTHYWVDDRFPGCTSVTKVGCSDFLKLIRWGQKYGLKKEWIHRDPDYPHFDLLGEKQRRILTSEEQWDQMKKFNL
ncbi:hypothetical protein [Gracilibacillus sp. YIM 98692]|uniref:hypothetical protein n=1 Tax=Gracilibacillus sp. YIM 98692 TaxID=2663532 RepID=UPI0013D3E411|nr:hypothetical protein [Gracilibacillus sp. YIM 98692]